MLKLDLQMAHIEPGRDLVLQEVALDRHTGGVVLHILHQGVADALHNAALGLDTGERRVDRDAAVNDGFVIEHRDKAGLAVQLDLDHADHEGRRRDRARFADRDLGGFVAEHLGLVANFGKADGLPGGRAAHAVAGEFELFGAAIKQTGRD